MASSYLQNLNLVIGLEWTLHESLNQARQALPKRNTPLHVSQKKAEQCALGVVVDLEKKEIKKTKKNKTKPLAGALAVASVMDSAVVQHVLEDGRIWICAINDGSPVPGFDRVEIDGGSAQAVLDEILSYMPHLTRVGNTDEAESSIEDVLEALDKRRRKQCQIIVPGERQAQVTRILLVAGVIVGLYSMRGVFIPEPPPPAPPPPPPVVVPPPPPEPEPEVEDTERILAIEKAHETVLHAVNPIAQYDRWSEVVRSLPVSVKGYAPIRSSCTPTFCDVEWRASLGALPSHRLELPGKLQENDRGQRSNQQGRTITRVPVTALSADEHSRDSASISLYLMDLDAASSRSQFRFQFIPAHREVRVNPPSIKGDNAPVTIGKEGSWTLSGTNPVLVRARLEQVALPGIHLTDGQFEMTASRMVRLNGTYIEKFDGDEQHND